MNGSTNADIHALSGAYVLDALPEDERFAFERHLADCGPCQREVGELRETAARLGSAVAEEPPPELRERVLSQVQRTRQLSPVVKRRQALTRPPWRTRAVFGLAAALLVAVLILTGATVQLSRQLDQERRQDRAVAAVLAAPDARAFTAQVATTGFGTAVVSRDSSRVVFVARGLPSLPEQRTYQLWFIGSGGARSAGLIQPGPDGRTEPRVFAGLRDAGKFGMTVEPAGGSQQPTTKPILLLTLSG